MVDKIKFDGRFISLSQSDDGATLDAKFLICPLDEGNLNNVGLKENDLTDSEKSGLTDKPVVCKIIKNSEGNYDATGHNMKIKYETNKEGKLVKVYEFDTSPVGFHTSSCVEEIEISGIKKNCIVATAKLWTRYTNFIKALQYLIDNGGIHTSWEIDFGDSYVEDGIKWLKNITWLGNCILGSTVTQAYKDAGMIELSEQDSELKLAIALAQDLNNIQVSSQSVKQTVENIIESQDQGGIDNMSEENKNNKAVASITNDDLYEKVRKAINATSHNCYYCISRIFPYEYRAIAYDWDRIADEDYIEFVYVVNSDDTISITSQKDVKMVFIAKETYDTTVAELQTKVSVAETKLAEKETELSTAKTDLETKVNSIAELGTQLSEKDKEIASLKPFKEQADKIESEKKETEIAQKKEVLKAFALKGGYIQEAELSENAEISNLIENLDEKGIKVIISERVIAKLEQTEKEVETSEVNITNVENI